MTGLVLKLAPFERVLVNGAVIENGCKRGRITIRTPNTNILRLKDAIHPDEVKTPVARICYIAQLVLSGDVNSEDGRAQIEFGLNQLEQVFIDDGSQKALTEARVDFNADRIYPGLKRIRSLLEIEKKILHQGAR